MVKKTTKSPKKAAEKETEELSEVEAGTDNEDDEKVDRKSISRRAGLSHAPCGRILKRIKDNVPRTVRVSAQGAIIVGSSLEEINRRALALAREFATKEEKTTIKPRHLGQAYGKLGLSNMLNTVSYMI